MKSGVRFFKLNRKEFLILFLLLLTSITSYVYYLFVNKRKVKLPIGQQIGANFKSGHLLQKPYATPEKISETITCQTLIIGAGISGLSAAYWLKKQNQKDTIIIDLNNFIGGNSNSGQNEITKYPWGAHYLPIPNLEAKEILSFLNEIDVIQSFDENGVPEYNMEHVCHAPNERLFINGMWQKGLIPSFGVPTSDSQEFQKFFELMSHYKHLLGNDGKKVFDIPIYKSSLDETYTKLDNESFFVFLTQKGFKSSYLQWYLNYCCKDDYGIDIHNCSAWAGIHYFAARYGKAKNLDSSSVLTWPEGNNFLAKKLYENSNATFLHNTIARKIEFNNASVKIYCSNPVTKSDFIIESNKCISATPQFVANKILPKNRQIDLSVNHSSWLVANITLIGLTNEFIENLVWDNVNYGENSLGYIWAENQKITSHQTSATVITFYYCLSKEASKTERIKAYSLSNNQQKSIIVTELLKCHPELKPNIQKIDTWIWGHGMVAPTIGSIFNPKKHSINNPNNKQFQIAHTDLSGISIFEEAFYQGINAAKNII